MRSSRCRAIRLLGHAWVMVQVAMACRFRAVRPSSLVPGDGPCVPSFVSLAMPQAMVHATISYRSSVILGGDTRDHPIAASFVLLVFPREIAHANFLLSCCSSPWSCPERRQAAAHAMNTQLKQLVAFADAMG
ncbi:hypothetical protein BD779DRAFT_1542849 [Infundibulicybe gibba]|nr:hypothetical protein BD779DRAFT_1542849 [Infundibulicybe gibba]